MQYSDPVRIILHVDMDSFYASVEVREHPEYKGKPVVVGADPKNGEGRGVVSTCSYEARSYGVHSGMAISSAYQLCPHAVFLPVNYHFYRTVSVNIMNIISRYAEKIEQVSVDEAYLDLTSTGSFEAAESVAHLIKDEIRDKERITCSIGIGPGKVVAKIASDYQKPDGLTVVKQEGVLKFLAPMPVRKIPGIGNKSADRLNSMGIATVGDLAAADVQKLRSLFGKWGVRMHALASGIDEREVEGKRECKSISREVTYEEDTADYEILTDTAGALAADVVRRLAGKGFRCRTVTVKVRYTGFVTRTRAYSFSHFTNDADVIKRCVLRILEEMFEKKSVRLIGVRLSTFDRVKMRQTTIDEYG